MKILKLLLVFTIVTITLSSCGEDFLDKRPTEFISFDDLEESSEINPELVSGNLRGLYNQMVTAGIGGTNSQEDFGHKSFDLMSDLLSSDLAQSGTRYNRFVALADLQWTSDASRTIPNYTAWRFYYTLIKSANLIIASAGGNDANAASEDKKAILGQAKALRAFGYFYLSQYYVVKYDPAVEALPIYKVPGEKSQPKSTMKEVYDLMIDDLKSSISLMSSFSRENKASIDGDVAKGLLAYVYASMGDSEHNLLARDLANEVIESGKFTLMSSDEVTGGFTKLNTPGWMWGFDLTKANDLGLVSWHGFMDYFSYSYQAVGNFRSIDEGLYNKINDLDIRKKQFGKPLFNDKGDYDGFADGASPLIPANKFYNLKREHFGQNPMEDDYVYMRVAEMYLLSAEMSAVEGQDAAAKTTLKKLLSKRFEKEADYAFIDGLSGQALIDEVVFQTKIELLAEGKSYLLMKRRKLSNTRGENHANKAGETFSYDDPRLTFEIPQKEKQNNPNIN